MIIFLVRFDLYQKVHKSDWYPLHHSTRHYCTQPMREFLIRLWLCAPQGEGQRLSLFDVVNTKACAIPAESLPGRVDNYGCLYIRYPRSVVLQTLGHHEGQAFESRNSSYGLKINKRVWNRLDVEIILSQVKGSMSINIPNDVTILRLLGVFDWIAKWFPYLFCYQFISPTYDI